MRTDQGDGRPAMTVEPLNTACAAVMERGEHACFGASPFNSYFSATGIDHQPPHVLRRPSIGELGRRPATGQGFAVVTPAGRE
ncbi:tRNA-dependent cyclodipeptide synthase [Streptomyces sp. 7N604]|uniref:tRNA-dependent cyclodipeptide synthase n=1 Tax=Streptomyces sp. 7N604 TaxID=3457415 RepID=UPI003FD17904